jgi:hypothetical protein
MHSPGSGSCHPCRNIACDLRSREAEFQNFSIREKMPEQFFFFWGPAQYPYTPREPVHYDWEKINNVGVINISGEI